MQEMIGDIAGRVWKTLGKKGELNIISLPMLLKIKSEIVYQGLGWLAREGKISYAQRDGKQFVSLTEAERNHFNSSQHNNH